MTLPPKRLEIIGVVLGAAEKQRHDVITFEPLRPGRTFGTASGHGLTVRSRTSAHRFASMRRVVPRAGMLAAHIVCPKLRNQYRTNNCIVDEINQCSRKTSCGCDHSGICCAIVGSLSGDHQGVDSADRCSASGC